MAAQQDLTWRVLVAAVLVLGAACTSTPDADELGTASERSRHPLLVQDGEAATGYGLVIADQDGARLCSGPAGNVEGGPFTFPTQPCPQGVPLRSLDTAALSPSGRVRAGNLTVTGTWRDGGLDVTSQATSGAPTGRTAIRSDTTQVPCPEPTGGWPTRAAFPQEDYPVALLALRRTHPDDVLLTAVLAPGDEDHAALGVVAADEAAAARAREALRPSYGEAACVVASAVTPEQFRAAAEGARYVNDVGEPELATGLQLVVRWNAVVVDEEVQRALDGLPQDLVVVSTVLQPVR